MLGNVIGSIYGQNTDFCFFFSTLPDLQQHVVAIERRLAEWMNDQPQSIDITRILQNPIGFPLYEDTQNTQSLVILSLRYLNLRALLHQATIYRLLDQQFAFDRQHKLYSLRSCVACCVESSVLSIKIISHAIQNRSILPIVWFSGFYSMSKLNGLR